MQISLEKKSLFGISCSLLIAAALSMTLVSPLPAEAKKKVQAAESAPLSKAISLDELEKMLQEKGIEGEIHAADAGNRQYVLTYREPKDFFSNIQVGMVSHKKEVLEFFEKMRRHDRVLVKGELFHRGEFFPESPQPHIEVKSIELLKRYEPPAVAAQKFEKKTQLPDELKGKDQAEFLVHAVLGKGSFLVLEYKDNFVFVVVPDKTLTANLFRNDRISMRYTIQSFPIKPTHLELDTDRKDGKVPLKVLDSIKALHGKAYTQEGYLVRYPKSPQINRDIWAIEQENSQGNARTFTLVNFKKAGEQARVDTKLKAWWDERLDGVVDGRNKLVNTKLKIRARGIMNVVDPNQANPQMQLEAKDLKLLSS